MLTFLSESKKSHFYTFSIKSVFLLPLLTALPHREQRKNSLDFQNCSLILTHSLTENLQRRENICENVKIEINIGI